MLLFSILPGHLVLAQDPWCQVPSLFSPRALSVEMEASSPKWSGVVAAGFGPPLGILPPPPLIWGGVITLHYVPIPPPAPLPLVQPVVPIPPPPPSQRPSASTPVLGLGLGGKVAAASSLAKAVPFVKISTAISSAKYGISVVKWATVCHTAKPGSPR